MLLLIISLLPLVVSPVCYEYLALKSKSFAVIEKIFFCVMVGLIVFRILPGSYAVAGWGVLLVAALGWFVPSLLEHYLHDHSGVIDRFPLMVSAVGIGLHSILDGVSVALADEHTHGGLHDSLPHFDFLSLPIAIIIHRVFEMIFLWSLLRPKFGMRASILFFVVIGSLTVFGFFASHEFIERLHAAYFVGYFEALVAGALLHLVTHKVSFGHRHAH